MSNLPVLNIRGTSGSGKSTLVKRLLDEYPHDEIKTLLSDWKKERTVAYRVQTPVGEIFVIGRYETNCGGCDAMSYKGSHDDIQELVMGAAEKGGVIFEGLTISSTLTRWKNVDDAFPGRYVWGFMDTPVETCYQRILARSGREPKRDEKGQADYQKKHSACQRHVGALLEEKRQVAIFSSDDVGYNKMKSLFGLE